MQEPKKSHQFRALTRKTLAYQKRQMCTNICCVGCCPFLMVAICGILTFAVAALIGGLSEVRYYTLCSDVMATDLATGLPSGSVNVTFTDKDGKEQVRQQVNFHLNGPCQQWFGSHYPYSVPYSAGPAVDNCTAFYNPRFCPLESTSTSTVPLYGWLPDVTSQPVVAAKTFSKLFSTQSNFWGYVATAEGVNVGAKTKGSSQRLFPPFGSVTLPQNSGLLGNITSSFYTVDSFIQFNDSTATFEPRPFYTPVNREDDDFEGVNKKLLEVIDSVIEDFNELEEPGENATQAELMDYALTVQGILKRVPFGALFFEKYTSEEVDYTLQIGTNSRVAFMSSSEAGTGADVEDLLIPFPAFLTEGLRRIIQQSKLSQAIMSAIPELSSYSITQGLRIFPEVMSTEFSFSISGYVGEILYPFGVSFLLPVFVVSIVKEKEERILVMMRMNGMKSWVYWLSEYIHFYILHILSSAVFIITGWIFRLEFFTLTDPGAYVLLFFIWGHTQIAMAFFFSTFFNKSRVALILVFCLVLAGVIINVSLGFLFNGTTPDAYLIYPPFAFYRGLSIMNMRSITLETPNYQMSMMVPGDEVFSCVIALIVETIILFLAGMYLIAVIPSEYGIHRPWHFIFTEPLEWLKKTQPKKPTEEKLQSVKITLDDEQPSEDHFKEDEDVQAERLRVYNNEYPQDSPVVIKDMRKIYPNGKLAVKSASLAIDKNSVFGLLGPNGAGKTTLISILTGLYPPSSGEAFLAGLNVNTEMKDIYLNIGVCPQHDILWNDLTVKEHLLFYARLKGVSPENEKAAVKAALATVSLTKFRNRLSKGLSGGEKRRLSIAIALIGDGKVIFLDEPTTGLDPEVRRLIWDIINRAKEGRTIILTTHSMEEAEVLCQRIGIMAKGTLRCLGPQVRLKNKYGSGFKISVSCNPESHEGASAYIESLLPAGWKKLDDFLGNFSYEFNAPEISSLLKEVGENKDLHGIKFWGISQTTLEEVFLRIIDEADAEAS